MVLKPDVIFNEVREIITENKIYETWMTNSSDGLMICEDKDYTILYINKQCVEMLIIDEQNVPHTLSDVFNEEEKLFLSTGKGGISKSFRGTLQISSIKINNYLLIAINDLTNVTTVEEKVNEIKQLNKELQTVYEQYADDTIIITDGEGVIKFSGTMTAANCGVSPGYMIGKNVNELESDKYFYPSVTAMVLKSKHTEVVIQNTKIGKTLVAVGTPIFDENGIIAKVISITRDYSKQIKIGTLLSNEDEIKNGRIDQEYFYDKIVTCNQQMLNILALCRLIANVDSTVLIYGETGTGKEVIARYIYSFGTKVKKPFIKINCGAISPSLVESELFGYEPGSFTGARKEGKVGLIEAANGGTLFLDEISELPLNQQVKLLQVIQERSMVRVGGTDSIKLDIRIIAATNKVLEEQVIMGEFREDLYYRLNVIPINIPPLRERKEDIPLLIRHFQNIFRLSNGKDKGFSKEAFISMCQYSWPGNVRELMNTVERLMITTKNTFIGVEELPEKIRENKKETSGDVEVKEIMKLSDAVKEVERKLIVMAVEKYGNGKKAAEFLGINQSTISRKMKQYGITV